MDYTVLFGQKSLNATGHMIGAKSVLSIWVVDWDPAKKDNSRDTVMAFDYRLADPETMRWEEAVIGALDEAAEVIESSEFELTYYIHKE